MRSVFAWFRRHLRVVLFVIIVLGILPAYAHAYRLTSTGASEVPNLLPQDTIIVNQAAYHLTFPYSDMVLFRTGYPKRGEMVLITLPNGRGVAPKRIMGLPGETIEIRENRLTIDGQTITSTTGNRSEFAWVPESGGLGSVVENEDGHWITYTPGKGEHRNQAQIRLANGQYFVVGDNRDASVDSRDWGPISEGSILGKVIIKLPTGPRK